MNSRGYLSFRHNWVACSLGALALLAPAAWSQTSTFSDISSSNHFKLGNYQGDPNLGFLTFRNNGIIVSHGLGWDSNNNFTPADLSTGVRLLWNPNKGIFRASYMYDWFASYGVMSAAFGAGSSHGHASFSTGYGFANGTLTAAFGWGNATGDYSISAGYYSLATGGASVAFGDYTEALNWGATALGAHTHATGIVSTALGQETRASAYATLAIGRFNKGDVSATGSNNWIAGDPLFEIGIGSGVAGAPAERANALTVYKDGRVTVHKRQGDIIMGQFGNGGGD